jgi:pimeloyl-ACP methyl ester carboxylesterase
MPLPARVHDEALSPMHLLYLHGFASSARSTKAGFFRTKAAEHGVVLLTPDFNEPDFAGLTISRMVAQVSTIVAGLPGEVSLIGSSLGGFVAIQAALREAWRFNRLVLLAPALEFSGDRLSDLGDRSLDEWRRTDTLNVYHYAFGRMMPVRFSLYQDATGYDALQARIPLPTQVFQGRRDTVVDPGTVQRWAEARPQVELHLLDDDHQLAASLDVIWREMARFVGIPAVKS